MGEVHFTDLSQYLPNSYLWDFGDGNFSGQTGGTVVHTYTKPGTYEVKLRVSNNIGFDTIAQTVTVSPFYSDFDYTNDTVLVNQAVSFYDSSYTANSWNWTFGDGSASTLQNPVHTYTQVGTYQVSLYATDSAGCQSNIQKTIYVISDIGVGELSYDFKVEVYPNPAKQNFYVKIDGLDPKGRAISVYDIAGKLVHKQSMNAETNETMVNPGNLSEGVYMVVISNSNGSIDYQSRIIID